MARRRSSLHGKRSKRERAPMTPSVAICLTSHDRLDCTRINEEIFKLNSRRPYTVVHASSGVLAAPYLEDAFVPCKPLPHPAGAIALMTRAIRAALPFHPDYLVLLDGDTWLLDDRVLPGWIDRLEANSRLLMATSSWWMPVPGSLAGRLGVEGSEIRRCPGNRLRRILSIPRRLTYDTMDFSTQFLILRNIRPLVELFCGLSLTDPRPVERKWFDCFAAHYGLDRVLRMSEREPVHPDHRFVCEPMGLYSQHWPAAGTSEDPRDAREELFVKPGTPGKREALRRHPQVCRGEAIQRLLQAAGPDDLTYYNASARRY